MSLLIFRLADTIPSMRKFQKNITYVSLTSGLVVLLTAGWLFKSHILTQFKYFDSFAVPALIRDLKAGDIQMRRNSASTLGEIGDHAKDAVPALIGALTHDEDYPVRVEAARALGKIG